MFNHINSIVELEKELQSVLKIDISESNHSWGWHADRLEKWGKQQSRQEMLDEANILRQAESRRLELED